MRAEISAAILPAAPAFVDDDGAVRPGDRGRNRLVVERAEGAEIDDLAGNSFPGQFIRRGQHLLQAAAIGDEADVAPGPANGGTF